MKTVTKDASGTLHKIKPNKPVSMYWNQAKTKDESGDVLTRFLGKTCGSQPVLAFLPLFCVPPSK